MLTLKIELPTPPYADIVADKGRHAEHTVPVFHEMRKAENHQDAM